MQLFRKLRNIDEGLNQSDFFKMQVRLGRYCQWVPRYQYITSQGLSSSEVRARILEYGENFIKISVPPVLHLVIHEGLNPFFLFQGNPQPQDIEFCRTFNMFYSILPINISGYHVIPNSLHRNLVDLAILLEVRRRHRHHLCRLCHLLRLGNSKGELVWLYININSDNYYRTFVRSLSSVYLCH